MHISLSQAKQYPLYLHIPSLDFFIKQGLFFLEINKQGWAILPENPEIDMLNAYTHLTPKLPLALVDDAVYGVIKNRFLEERDENNLFHPDEFESQESIENFTQQGDLLDDENSAPIIRYLNTMFLKAIKQRATDIHVEIFEKDGKIRFRVDGILQPVATLPKSAARALINRIKIISDLDISETRLPQDGRTKITIAKSSLDVRVSILPTYHGEKAVLRLLMKEGTIPSLQELGFNDAIYQKLVTLRHYSYGMILITGPTGSGKSTTMHSFLKEIDHQSFNIVTIENPIEYKANGINQIQVNEKAGLTFSRALRAILRQDPDVIMVGEMRDHETTTIAVQAAMTGHLLLSTLHTNHAISAITRLIEMGIDPFLVRSTLIGVLAQRLVRKLCPQCKKPYQPTLQERTYFQLPNDLICYTHQGCEACNHSGYHGRQAIGEIIIMNEALSMQIQQGVDERSLRHFLMEQEDFLPMFNQLRQLIIEGKTSIFEAFRIGVKNL